jgi:hypothetical protein
LPGGADSTVPGSGNFLPLTISAAGRGRDRHDPALHRAWLVARRGDADRLATAVDVGLAASRSALTIGRYRVTLD